MPKCHLLKTEVLSPRKKKCDQKRFLHPGQSHNPLHHRERKTSGTGAEPETIREENSPSFIGVIIRQGKKEVEQGLRDRRWGFFDPEEEKRQVLEGESNQGF